MAERYARVCPECSAPIQIGSVTRTGRGFRPTDAVVCPNGHRPVGWHVFDRELRAVIGAAHVDYGGALHSPVFLEVR